MLATPCSWLTVQRAVCQLQQNIGMTWNSITMLINDFAPAGEVLAAKFVERGPQIIGMIAGAVHHLSKALDSIFNGRDCDAAISRPLKLRSGPHFIRDDEWVPPF